ncbi:MAG: hypothetical protein H0U36_03370 [Nocardioidaceae bacterium]|nr:hypothetical protein [Nocardioidaceae bacterium]
MDTATPARGRSGSASRRRWLVPALVSVVLLGALTGCGAGFDAQTNQPYQPAPGVTVRTSDVYTVNTLVVTDGEGDGTVVTSLVNQASEPDKLVGLTAQDGEGGGVEVSPLPDGGIELAPGQAVQTATDGALRVHGDTLQAGSLITLAFEFESAARVEVEVPVLAASTEYADVPIGPAGGESPSPSSSPTPSE